MIQSERKAFTIVELVIVIAVIAVLAAVLVPTFASVINNAEESNAMQEAKNAYIDYLAATDVTNPQPMVYQSKNKFVALKDGQVGGIYSTKTEALAEIGFTEADGEYMFDTGNGLLGYYKPTAGATFASNTDTLTICEKFTEPVVTFEAWIKLPTTYPASGGTIFGSYTTSLGKLQNFEIGDIHPEVPDSYAKARLLQYLSTSNLTRQHIYLTGVDLNTDKWTHIAIVNDSANSKVHYYVNGVFFKSYTATITLITCDNAYRIGNNVTPDDKFRFKGQIHSIAVYSDVRTAQEISKDAISPGNDGLIARWDLSNVPSGPTTVTDLSGNGYNASRS